MDMSFSSSLPISDVTVVFACSKHVHAYTPHPLTTDKTILSIIGWNKALGDVQLAHTEHGLAVIIYIDENSTWTPTEMYRRATSGLGKHIQKYKWNTVGIISPSEDTNILKAICEGILLSSYSFDTYKADKQQPCAITLLGQENETLLKEIAAMTRATYFVRDLVNTPPSDCTPADLEKAALEISQHASINTTVIKGEDLQKEKLNGIWNVGKGSEVAPRLIRLEYKNNPTNSKPYCLVGKGVTFDAGGYNIKPTNHIEDMKCDMGGAATVLGIFKLLTELEPNLHVIGYVPTVENLVSHNAYLPGDVITMYNGKTVEVNNTDAEGRLILADSLCKASEDKPEWIIDFATLTGAVIYAVGPYYTGVLTNDQELQSNFLDCCKKEDERAWALPMDKDYADSLKGDISDLFNISKKIKAGASIAGLFLQNFVEKDIPWIHLDIAGTAFIDHDHFYNPKGATGTILRSVWNFMNKK